MIHYSIVPNIWNERLFLQENGENNHSIYICTKQFESMSIYEFQNLKSEEKATISYLQLMQDNPLRILDLTGFVNLNVLNIQEAGICEIKGVSSLVRLNVILAEGNELQSVDEFVDLPRLQWFDCPDNRITQIKEFPPNTLVCQVDFRQNPFTGRVGLPPEEQILECGKSWYIEARTYNEWRDLREKCNSFRLKQEEGANSHNTERVVE